VGGKQVEALVAVKSLAEFCRITGWPYKAARDFTGLPGYNNPGEAVALAKPGAIFWRALYDYSNEHPFREISPDKLRR
jgi:hypothetical protein